MVYHTLTSDVFLLRATNGEASGRKTDDPLPAQLGHLETVTGLQQWALFQGNELPSPLQGYDS